MSLRSRLAPAALALAAVLAAAAPARAQTLAGLVEILQPGSRPAPGLGGDPFLSPIGNDAGWWAGPGLVEPRGTQFEAGWSAPLPGSGTLDSRRLAWTGVGAWRGSAGVLRVGARASALAGESRLAGDLGTLRLASRGRRLEGGARFSGLTPGLTLQVAGPLWSEGGSARFSSAGVGARLAPARWIAAQARVEDLRARQHFDSDLYGEPISAALDLAGERWQADARVLGAGGLALEGSVARSRYAPDARGRAEAGYAFRPAGTSDLDQASLSWRATPLTRLLARWTRSAFEVEGDAVWGGVRFGHVTYARAESRGWLLAVDRRSSRARLLLDAEWVEAGGAARGSIEAWPFTEATADLLGLRRIGRASAEARWWRVHAGLEQRLGGALRASGGLAWYEARADARLESWQPTFLVFGVTDFRRDAMPWRGAQLAIASLGLRAELRGVSAAVEIQQPVFGRVWERTASAAYGGGGAGAPGAGGASSGHRDLGTQVRVRLARGLGAD